MAEPVRSVLASPAVKVYDLPAARFAKRKAPVRGSISRWTIAVHRVREGSSSIVRRIIGVAIE